MATLQICYKDATGKVVCKDSTVSGSTLQMASGKPKRKEVKDAITAMVDSMIADTPEYFALLYTPDGVESPPTEPTAE